MTEGNASLPRAIRNTVPHALIGAAGFYYVASELSRRGLIALPTIRNTKGYDIIVSNTEGTRHANIDVKTSQACVKFWPMPPSNRVCHGPNDYYVLLRWLKKENRFEGFMVTGAEAKQEVYDGNFPVIYVGTDANGKDSQWKERWQTWRL